MGKFGITEILLIVVVVLILFGGRKIPELMKGLGQGVNEFKKGIAGDDKKKEDKKDEKVESEEGKK
jgi:sec-independent protein translocase protein TatA